MASVAGADKAEKKDQVLKVGKLSKRGGKYQSWKSRNFVLTTSRITYYNGKEMKGLILICDIISVSAATIEKKKYCFEIRTPPRRYYLCAENDVTMLSWMMAIDKLCPVPEFPAEPSECWRTWRTAFENSYLPTFYQYKHEDVGTHCQYETLHSMGVPNCDEVVFPTPLQPVQPNANIHLMRVTGSGGVGVITMTRRPDASGWLVVGEEWEQVLGGVGTGVLVEPIVPRRQVPLGADLAAMNLELLGPDEKAPEKEKVMVTEIFTKLQNRQAIEESRKTTHARSQTEVQLPTPVRPRTASNVGMEKRSNSMQDITAAPSPTAGNRLELPGPAPSNVTATQAQASPGKAQVILENEADIVYMMTDVGQTVKLASFERLVERLTSDTAVDMSLSHTFMLTYRAFTTPEGLMRALTARFNSSPPAEATPEQRDEFNNFVLKPVRLRVFNVLKGWLNVGYRDFENNNELVDLFKELVNVTMVQADMERAAQTLLALFNKNVLLEPSIRGLPRIAMAMREGVLVEDRDFPPGVLCKKSFLANDAIEWMLRNIPDVTTVDACIEIGKQMVKQKLIENSSSQQYQFGNGPLPFRFTISRYVTEEVDPAVAPPPVLPRAQSVAELSFCDLSMKEVARQMTLIEQGIFSAIEPKELLGQGWQKGNKLKNAPNVVAMIERFNEVSNWVGTEITSHANINDRVKCVRCFIKLASELKNLQNFNGLQEILSGMAQTGVYRLKRTWERVEKKEMAIKEALDALMAPTGSYKAHRWTLKNLSPPCIPYLGMFLTDLTFIEEGNAKTLQNMINFDKHRKVAHVVEEVIGYQRPPYVFVTVPVIKDYLEDLKQVTETEAYERSLEVEPRDAPSGGDTPSGRSSFVDHLVKKTRAISMALTDGQFSLEEEEKKEQARKAAAEKKANRNTVALAGDVDPLQMREPQTAPPPVPNIPNRSMALTPRRSSSDLRQSNPFAREAGVSTPPGETSPMSLAVGSATASATASAGVSPREDSALDSPRNDNTEGSTEDLSEQPSELDATLTQLLSELSDQPVMAGDDSDDDDGAAAGDQGEVVSAVPSFALQRRNTLSPWLQAVTAEAEEANAEASERAKLRPPPKKPLPILPDLEEESTPSAAAEGVPVFATEPNAAAPQDTTTTSTASTAPETESTTTAGEAVPALVADASPAASTTTEPASVASAPPATAADAPAPATSTSTGGEATVTTASSASPSEPAVVAVSTPLATQEAAPASEPVTPAPAGDPPAASAEPPAITKSTSETSLDGAPSATQSPEDEVARAEERARKRLQMRDAKK